VCNKGSHSFTCHPLYSPAARCHSPAARRHRPVGWYSLRLPSKGWPGYVDLDGWLYTEINVSHQELNTDTVTHPSTNRARRGLTSLIETNTLPLNQSRPPPEQFNYNCYYDHKKMLTLRDQRCYASGMLMLR